MAGAETPGCSGSASEGVLAGAWRPGRAARSAGRMATRWPESGRASPSQPDEREQAMTVAL